MKGTETVSQLKGFSFHLWAWKDPIFLIPAFQNLQTKTKTWERVSEQNNDKVWHVPEQKFPRNNFKKQKRKTKRQTEKSTWRLRPANRGVFKERKGKLLMGNTDIKQNKARRRVVYRYALDGKPEKELFLRQAFQTTEPAEGQICSDHTLVVHSGIELGQTRPFQMDFETSQVVQIVRLDGVREETRR